MAQYIEVQGTSFGNAHSDNPTYAFTVGTGTVLLSGSGGYVNAATGITKAELTSGVKLKVSDDTISAVTCSVESGQGFTCDAHFEYATWTVASPTPTPTPSGETGTCRNVWVSSTYDSSTQYGIQYIKPGIVTPTRVAFATLIGTSYTYGGVAGTVFSVCSTATPDFWDFNANGGSGAITTAMGSDAVILADGGTCQADGDCSFTPPTPSPTRTITPTPSAQLRTLLLTDEEPDSTIDGGAGLSIGSTQVNYTQADVDAGNQPLLGPILISYAAGEDFTINSVNLNDGLGGSYTYTLSDYVGGAGYYLSITGSFPDTAGGTTTTVDVTVNASSIPTYEHELRWNVNGISNAVGTYSLESPSTANLTLTANTSSFTGRENAYYTASFKFEANNNYAWNGFNDVTVALSDGTPATNISKVYQRFSGSSNEFIEIGYAGDIGANDAFASLTFSGTPEYAAQISNANDITVRYRVPGGSGTYYDLIVSGAVQGTVTSAANTAGATIDIRPTTHDGKYEIVNNLNTPWITSITPNENNTIDDITHTITLAENTGASDRYTTVILRTQDGSIAPKLNIPISQSGTA